jgi:hypothetical protein
MHHEIFNTDFYVTGATVIPVLYLALAIQGDVYVRVATLFHKIWKKGTSRWQNALGGILYFALFIAGLAIVAYAGLGEILAILALYHRSASSWMALSVLISVILLLVAVLAWPAVNIVIVFLRDSGLFGNLFEDIPRKVKPGAADEIGQIPPGESEELS